MKNLRVKIHSTPEYTAAVKKINDQIIADRADRLQRRINREPTEFKPISGLKLSPEALKELAESLEDWARVNARKERLKPNINGDKTRWLYDV